MKTTLLALCAVIVICLAFTIYAIIIQNEDDFKDDEPFNFD